MQEAGSWRIQTTVTTSLAMNATSHLIKVVVVKIPVNSCQCYSRADGRDAANPPPLTTNLIKCFLPMGVFQQKNRGDTGGLDEIVKSGLQWARMGSDGHGYLALVAN